MFLTKYCLFLQFYSNNKNHKVQITDFEFINNVFIESDGQDRY